MAKLASNRQQTHAEAPKKTEEPSLKGAFASVMLLGGFLVIVWVLVFALFMVRN